MSRRKDNDKSKNNKSKNNGEDREIKNTNEFLGTEPVAKLLIRLAVPTVAAQIINML
jgi:hypothetical protein